MQTLVIRTHSEEETIDAGSRFAGSLKPGDVVALIGDLGSGKTRFAKGLARGLGVREHVTSPTFTILHEYTDGRLPVYHFDCYRMKSARELDEFGFDDYVYGDGVCVLEWADMIEERLPAHRYEVRCALGETASERTLTISEIG
ncbi:MAG: tRNA (adenosine(37)-N6)-threonylcarbamoyltransferase complex ATPase subunit type 1 TsaE [Acidobacteriota bacterium]